MPNDDFKELSKYVVGFADGLPLALEVLGSFLCSRDAAQWERAIEGFQRDSSKEIIGVLRNSFDGLMKELEKHIFHSLRISFDGLEETEKNIFLDIACFFEGEEKDFVIKVLDGCEFSADIGIDVLVAKSLVTVDEDNRLRVHGLLKEMGREIVRQKSIKEPGKRCRLWDERDVHHVLTQDTATEVIEGMVIDNKRESNDILNLSADAFSKMKNLRLLKVLCVLKCNHLSYLSNELRLLAWNRCPLRSLPSSFQPHNLVALILPYSRIELLWEGIVPLYKLNLINLEGSQNLIETPDFTKAPNLEILILEDCTRLVDVHPSIGVLRRLKLLNLKGCKSLRSLPTKIRMESLEKLTLSGCHKIENLQEMLGQAEILSSLTELNLSYCNLGEEDFPSDICCLSALKILNLSGNHFTRIPSSLTQLSGLYDLDLSYCKELKSLPGPLTTIERLRTDGCVSLAENINMAEQMLDNVGSSCSPSVSPCIFRTPFPRLQFQDPQLASICPYHKTKDLPLEEYKYGFLDRFLSRTKKQGKDLRFYVEKMMSLECRMRGCYSEDLSMSSSEFVEMMLLDGCFIMEVLLYFAQDGGRRGTSWGREKEGGRRRGTREKGGGAEDMSPGYLSEMEYLKIGGTSWGRKKGVGAEDISPGYLSRIDYLKIGGTSWGREKGQKMVQDCVSKDWVFPIEPWQLPVLVRDLLILENQIPFFVLEMLFESLKESQSQEETPTLSLPTMALKFFGLAFPRSIDISCEFDHLEPDHLLDLFLHSIYPSSPIHSHRTTIVLPNFVHSFLKKINARNQSSASTEDRQYDPPLPFYLTKNVMELQASGIELRPRIAARFTDIDFNNGVLEIPSVSVDDLFITILNNGVAFEHCSNRSSKDLSAYVSFMSKLIRHPTDAELLSSNGIISSFSHNDEKVFNSFLMLWRNISHLDFQHSYLSERLKELECYYTRYGRTRPWQLSSLDKIVLDAFRILWMKISDLVLSQSYLSEILKELECYDTRYGRIFECLTILLGIFVVFIVQSARDVIESLVIDYKNKRAIDLAVSHFIGPPTTIERLRTDGCVTPEEEKIKMAKQMSDKVAINYKPVSPCIFRTPFPRLHKPVSPCIFRTPFPRLQFQQDPLLASIGPYHKSKHLPLEKYKYELLDIFLSRTRKQDKDLRFYVGKMMSLERRARECYSEELEMSSSEFVKMMLLDGCFIVEALAYFADQDDGVSKDWVFPIQPRHLPILVRDLLLLENQIPFFVLEMLFESLKGSQSQEEEAPTLSLPTMALKFFDLAFPRSIDISCEFDHLEPDHLLDLFLHSIYPSSPIRSHWTTMVLPNYVHSFLKKINARNQSSASTEDQQYDPQLPFFLTRNVKELQASGIELRPRIAARFTDIDFNNGVLEIPSVSVDDLFIAVLNNGVAFEHCSNRSSKDLSAYVSFMSKLMRDPTDAELLSSNGIISSFSHNDEKVFNSFHMLWRNISHLDFQHSYLSERLKELECYYTRYGRTRPWQLSSLDKIVLDSFRILWMNISDLVLPQSYLSERLKELKCYATRYGRIFECLLHGILVISVVQPVKFLAMYAYFHVPVICMTVAVFLYKSARLRVVDWSPIIILGILAVNLYLLNGLAL